jgi:hypothetical protein
MHRVPCVGPVWRFRSSSEAAVRSAGSLAIARTGEAAALLSAQTRCLAEQGGMPVATRKHDSRERWIRSGAALSSGRRFAVKTALGSWQRKSPLRSRVHEMAVLRSERCSHPRSAGTGSRCREEPCVMCCRRRTSFNGRIDNSRFKRLGDRGVAMIIWVEVIGGKSAAP